MRDASLVTRVLVGVLAVGGLFVIGMPASGARSKPPTVTIVGKDFSFEMPDAIKPGWTTIDFDNRGQEEHQVQLARLNGGVTQDQFNQALIASASDNAIGALKLVRLAGGVNAIPAGTSGSAVVKLNAGNYVALCFVSGDDEIPHVAKGMIKYITVDGAANKAAAPKAKATITSRDFSFSIPKKLSGTPPIAFTNKGPESHELTLMKLNPGVTIDDVKNLFLGTGVPTGPPPTEVGGVGAIAPKTTAYLNTELAKGKYVAVCFVPDPKTGKAHVELGMFAPFTVS